MYAVVYQAVVERRKMGGGSTGARIGEDISVGK